MNDLAQFSRSTGLLLGVAADAVLGDPQRHHPVAWHGRYLAWLEDRLYADSIARGAAYTAAALAPVAVLAFAADKVGRRHSIVDTALTATATWVVLGGRSLVREAEAMAAALDSDDLPAARQRLTHLCSRNPEHLDATELARGTVESLAENTTDAVVCSLFWGATAGIPGLLLHRAVNTADAMIGYRSTRFERFGKVSARLDDAAAWVPARVAGALACLLAPVVGGDVNKAWRVMARDAHRHPSPNGGWSESAWAGALDVRLGGPSTYHDATEHRPHLGDADAPPPDPRTITRATRLVSALTGTAALLAALGSAGRRPRR